MFVDVVVKQTVEVVEEVDDLHRTAGRRQLREADDVGEEDRHGIKHLRLHLAASLQLFRRASAACETLAQYSVDGTLWLRGCVSLPTRLRIGFVFLPK